MWPMPFILMYTTFFIMLVYLAPHNFTPYIYDSDDLTVIYGFMFSLRAGLLDVQECRIHANCVLRLALT